MFDGASPDQAVAVLAAMNDIATLGGSVEPSLADSLALKAAAHYVFRQPEDLEPRDLPPVTAGALASKLETDELRLSAVQHLAVMALIDGVLDQARIARVSRFAAVLGVDRDFLATLSEAATGHLRWAGMDMVRHNMLSITGRPWAGEDVMPWLLPYGGDGEDRALAERFHALEARPPDSLGRAFWQHYSSHGFAFPGEPEALNAVFAVPHDTTHLLSGYDTSYRGEILVSTFTAGMHPDQPMAGHILPVIFSWHLGIELVPSAGSHKGALDVEHFWEAWARGSEMKRDVFSPTWRFWELIDHPLDGLREAYAIPPLEEGAPS